MSCTRPANSASSGLMRDNRLREDVSDGGDARRCGATPPRRMICNAGLRPSARSCSIATATATDLTGAMPTRRMALRTSPIGRPPGLSAAEFAICTRRAASERLGRDHLREPLRRRCPAARAPLRILIVARLNVGKATFCRARSAGDRLQKAKTRRRGGRHRGDADPSGRCRAPRARSIAERQRTDKQNAGRRFDAPEAPHASRRSATSVSTGSSSCNSAASSRTTLRSPTGAARLARRTRARA